MFLLTCVCWFFCSSTFWRLFFFNDFQIYPSFSGIPGFMEGLTRLVVIYWCDLPGSSHFQMGNIVTRFPIPSGIFSTCCPNKDSILAFRSSFIPTCETFRLYFCFFSEGSLVKGLSFTPHLMFLFFHSPYLNCKPPLVLKTISIICTVSS